MDYTAIGINLTFTGMSVVFVGLIILLMIMKFFQWLDARIAAPRAAAPAPAASATPGTLSPQDMAVISAAVAIAIGKPVRVRRIRYRRGSPESTWTRQGRITIMGSHHIK